MPSPAHDINIYAEDLPFLVFADRAGKIREHPRLRMLGMSGRVPVLPLPEELVPLPFGSTLFYMPGRIPLGWDMERKELRAPEASPSKQEKEPCFAVAAFLPPGYVRTLLPAMRLLPNAPALPLWAYAAVGWKEERFWATGTMVDPNPHWDPVHFQDDEGFASLVRKALAEKPTNRLLRHLGRCALEYHCFAAKNCFYRRWELPLPTSPTCNARCLGCISLQPAGCCPAPHGRIRFVPTAEEICEITLPHLLEAEDPIASFGQGCEGEPILQAAVIRETLLQLRTQTSRGVININTNGSRPEAIGELCRSGMDSVRVTLNSPDPALFTAYHKPRHFSIKDVKDSLIRAREAGASAAINLLVFPGVTDRKEERDVLAGFIRETGIDQIQMRNLNIDPDLYLKAVKRNGNRYSLSLLMADLKAEFPGLSFGYFNRAKREGG